MPSTTPHNLLSLPTEICDMIWECLAADIYSGLCLDYFNPRDSQALARMFLLIQDTSHQPFYLREL